jgi:DNA-binding NarL/FixJ family response regulator
VSSPERLLAVLTWAEAEQITVPPSAAARLLEALDAVPSGKSERKPWTRWTPEEDAELRRRFVAGEPVREIAEALNRSRGQINGALTRLALTRSGEPQQSTLVHRNGDGPGRKRKDAGA